MANRWWNLRHLWHLGAPRAMVAGTLAVVGLAQGGPASDSILKRHFDEAQRLQGEGDFPEAARQYRIFIADGLGEMALRAAALGDYGKAAPLFDEALRLAPNSPALMVRYGQAALAAGVPARARTLAERVLREFPTNNQAVAKAHMLAGRAMQRMNQEAAARAHFEAAVALEPTFENGYALAIVCLDLDDRPAAAKVFAEMIAGLGDTAQLHLEIGRAYLNSDFQPESVPELRRAVALDGTLPRAHASLAAALLTVGGEGSLEMAQKEIEAELKLSPNDSSAHVQAGDVALRQQRYADADAELRRAIALDANNPDAFFYLGKVCAATQRRDDAIRAFQQTIALTKDPAYNRYQVQKAHYLLGRLLMEAGQKEAGGREMEISSALLKASLSKDRDRLAGTFGEGSAAPGGDVGLEGHATDAKTAKGALPSEEFEKRLAPALADSYNNLGVIAAGVQAFDEALVDFVQAATWSPGMEGLDANWGRAAFHAGQPAQAIAPLRRALRAGGDAELHSELAMSLFTTGDYAGTLRVLGPEAAQPSPLLTYVQAAALIKTGGYDEGVKRLLALEANEPQVAEVHEALGEGYAGRKDLPNAARELELAVKLKPQYADAFRALGVVRMAQGQVLQAIVNLEAATKINPADAVAHRELAAAYRKQSRGADAAREQNVYEDLLRTRSEVRGPASPDVRPASL